MGKEIIKEIIKDTIPSLKKGQETGRSEKRMWIDLMETDTIISMHL